MVDKTIRNHNEAHTLQSPFQRKASILLFISGICLIFLFIGGPNRFSPRSYKHAWDLGHIVAFSLWSYLLLQVWQRIAPTPFFAQCFWTLLIMLCVGMLIEVLQSNMDRTSSVGDVLNDLLGTLITLVFVIPSRRYIHRNTLRILQGGVLFLFLVALFPLTRALIDEAITRRQFPVLSTFETPFEIERWKSNNSTLTLDPTIAKSGKASLKISLTTAQYSGASFVYFSRDWRNFKFLQLDIFTASSELSQIHCRIHDKRHVANDAQPYDDRFNGTFLLHRGWNTIKIPVDRILNAPVHRTMDLAHIDGLGVFVVRLPTPEAIYIDHVRLVK